jgi:hypothetical protein
MTADWVFNIPHPLDIVQCIIGVYIWFSVFHKALKNPFLLMCCTWKDGELGIGKHASENTWDIFYALWHTGANNIYLRWQLAVVCIGKAECGVSECDRESSKMRRPWPTVGSCAMVKKIIGHKTCSLRYSEVVLRADNWNVALKLKVYEFMFSDKWIH